LTNLAEYAWCQLNDVESYMAQESRNVLKDIGINFYPCIPTVRFRAPADEKHIETIRGYGFVEDGKLPGVFTGQPQANVFLTVMKLGITDTRLPAGQVGIDGYLAYISCLRAVRLFVMATQYYNASYPVLLSHADASSSGNYHGIDGSTSYKAPRLNGSLVDKVLPVPHSAVNHFGLFRQVPFYMPFTDSQRIDVTYMRATETTAIPEGFFFPYFDQMMVPDKTYTENVFARLFFRTLGNSVSDCQKTWKRIRDGLRQLASSDAGMVINHMMMGVQMAENSQGHLQIVIQDQVYHGFCIFGSHVRIIVRGTLCLPDKSVRAEIKSVNKHDRLLAEIVAIFNLPVRDDGTAIYNFTTKDIDSSRKFLRVFRSLDQTLITAANLKSIVSKVSDLQYGDLYAKVTSENIIKALTYIITEDEKILDEFPTYLGNGYFQSYGAVSTAFAIFGPRAPDFNYGQKKEHHFVLGVSGEDQNLVKQASGKNKLEFLAFQMAPIRTAVQHWDSLLSSGDLYVPHGRQGVKKPEFTDPKKKDGQFGGTEFAPLYRKMVEAVLKCKKKDGAGKRKRADETESGAGKRARKDADTNVADADMF